MNRRRSYKTAEVVLAALIIFLAAGMAALVPARARADDALDARHLSERARQTLETFSQAPEMDAFRNLIKNARGVFIAPQILKGAFIVGASGGSGVLVARDSLSGRWLGPAFYTIGAASFGFQIGGSASEVVLLAMTDRGVKALLENSIKLGADVGLAAGPVGMGAAASTANLSADIISFARSKGLYGGISLDGAVVKTREDWNSAYYGGIVTPYDIFRKRTARSPQSVGLLATVSRLSDGARLAYPDNLGQGAGPADMKRPPESAPGEQTEVQKPAEAGPEEQTDVQKPAGGE
ncbi:MAG: lipid-binding SYLF domain-containing protein [Syntrophorhabdales bacterium]|jgi:lipid-binding SYLF domain-containing protein